ncbi:5'-AMP-activated protein kinase subunit gamma-2-like [Zophobas morio]|uniref:5'-AMP-activated protein kinase subunit gamma-2-like n=1 Tax=Zophobas morio TaxID=2755281 RepID=UPI003082B259
MSNLELSSKFSSPCENKSVSLTGKLSLTKKSSKGAIVNREKKNFQEFLAKYECYAIMPVSSKMVVFDTSLLVNRAFFALLQNGVRSAPVWDTELQKFVGMVTITDFINILLKYYRTPNTRMDELEDHKIQTWRVHIEPKDSLLKAVRYLLDNKIHRLPVIDPSTGNALYILTHKRILSFIHQNFNLDDVKCLDFTLQELGVGTHENIATVKPNTPLIEVLNLFSKRRISALPIVDENNVVVNIYAKCDVINLARERAYNNLNTPVSEALKHRADTFEGVHTCKLTDSMRSIINQIVKARVHRLIVVCDNNTVISVVSLSDVLSFLLNN